MREDKICAATAAPNFSFTQARVAVAQICQSIGYKGAERPALEALTDIATRYLKAIAKLSAESANSSGRTESNLFDIAAAIEDLASVQGFDGSWRVRSRSVWRSAAIRDLMKCVKYMDQIPFAQPSPPRVSCSGRGRVLSIRDNSLWYNEGKLKHVPRWLPAVEVEVLGEEEEKRRGEVKWEEGFEREEAANLGSSEMKKLKRECYDEDVEQVLVKRGKVRFKIGNVGMFKGNGENNGGGEEEDGGC
ncbi:transcription initiation factor TFIID subunit 8-like [Salvia divinorum]|uniref:Transcription initiation factor TFIID subunit 8-like n=1 Tax=Salvia divinorum TaxID=28513 RepID=A0ABD1HAK6_SALDI